MMVAETWVLLLAFEEGFRVQGLASLGHARVGFHAIRKPDARYLCHEGVLRRLGCRVHAMSFPIALRRFYKGSLMFLRVFHSVKGFRLHETLMYRRLTSLQPFP